MKFIHTSDWHLGKVLQGQPLLEDQQHMLHQLVAAVESEKPAAVIIAGDLYDRSIPPAEAVKLLDDTLHQLVVTLKTPVLAVAGNHDSPSRLRFGNRLMKAAGYHIAGELTDAFQPVTFTDAHGPVDFFLLPYADLGTIRQHYPETEITGYGDAYRLLLEDIETHRNPNARCVLVTHAFVTPGGEPEANTSDAEKQLSVGGVEFVPAELFQSFHYTALGHLHQGRQVMEKQIRYAGSPLKYSIREAHHAKAFDVVELDEKGEVTVTPWLVKARRDVRTVTGRLQEVENHPPCQDYVWVGLTDEHPAPEAMERIRSVYPNALGLRWEALHRKLDIEAAPHTLERHRPAEIVESFFETFTGQALSTDDRKLVTDLLEEAMQEEQGGEA
ncbi:exonuclease SbcCD subunit D [Anoxynatronum sibiricum]|uniref:Nuclease SbcCD subunit D n=1 Tax=Anoxynatronum sibiricum TaxID=210623 RepID=A0ABU9VYX3_9CLOT